MASQHHDTAQVTVSLLPASLSLVHIPRSRRHGLSHPILRQVLTQNPTFLNITCNEIELSIFAEHQYVVDFEHIARRDRLRHRTRPGPDSLRRPGSASRIEPVEISYERWSVLQVDSHSEPLDNSGARVRELSAPLANAGISILYQSSYTSDFILVKETRLQEVMSLLAFAGFDVYSSDLRLLNSADASPLLSSSVPGNSSLIPAIGEDMSSQRGQCRATRCEPAGGGRSTPCRASTLRSGCRTLSCCSSDQARSKSHSPTAAEVRVISSDLTCVGLSNDSFDYWVAKIIKLLAFPDLIHPSVGLRPVPTQSPVSDSFESSQKVFQLASVDKKYSATALFPQGRPINFDSSSSDDDGYFSHSPEGDYSTPFFTSSHSLPDLQSITNSSRLLRPPSKHIISPLPPISPGCQPRHSAESPDSTSEMSTYPYNSSQVPFFSFTRTSEGSSLCTDVPLLAALFPPSERHTVICSGELDALDAHDLGHVDSSDDEDQEAQGGSLKCLQIDLRRFGLDKHGLVSRFSRVLEENGINHMYSSTFKTANLLVDKRRATRARSLLSAC